MAKQEGVSVGDESIQIKYLLQEIEQGGYSEWKNATNYNDACEIFCDTFEKPGVKNIEKRKKKAKYYYDLFANKEKPSSSNSNKIISTAKSKLGCAYVWGATGPNTFDCSGLVQWVYKQNGISLPRTTNDYKKYLGSKNEVSWSEAQPGDLVWRIGHIGIYLGNNEYIHAPEPGDVVKISSSANSQFTNVFRFTK